MGLHVKDRRGGATACCSRERDEWKEVLFERLLDSSWVNLCLVMDFCFISGFVVGRSRMSTVCLAKGKKGRNSSSASPRKNKRSRVQKPKLPENFVTAMPGNEDIEEVNAPATLEDFESKLTPIKGSEVDVKREVAKKAAVGKEPPTVTILKQATWAGIAILVVIEIVVHVFPVKDWLTKQ